MKEALKGNHKNDEFYTPLYAIEPLLKYIPKNITIWEATDYGKSNISLALENHGCKVIKTHIKDGINFIDYNPTFNYDMIITNPPYTQKNEFLEKCYKLNKPFALLLPLTALEGIERGKLFRKYGIDLLVLDKRIEFIENKSNWFNTSWFTWHILPKALIFEELKKGAKQ